MTGVATQRALVIGASGLDWPSLHEAAERGLIPNLQALGARGSAGRLRADPDCVSPGFSGWASLVTGLPTAIHDVWREQEAWAGGLRATGRASWRVPPLWTRLAAAGVATGGVAWPGLRAGADWAGEHVADSYGQATGPDRHDWALPLHCAPSHLREALRPLRVHPADIGIGQLLPLVPDIAAIDQDREPGLALLAVAMAQAATIQAAAVHLLTRPDWQTMFVHHRWLGDLRARGSLMPPWDQLLDGGWRFLDGLIGRLAALAGPDCLIIVASPGWGRCDGAVFAAGHSVVPDRVARARVGDIAPTLLAHFGLQDPTLPGQSLVEAVRSVRVIGAADPPPDAGGGRTALDHVVALGYAPPAGPPLRWHVDGLIGMARLLLPSDPHRAGEAAAAALRLAPDDLDALSLGAAAHVAANETEPLPELAQALLRLAPDRPWGALVHGAYYAVRGEAAAARPWLLAAEAAGEPLRPCCGCSLRRQRLQSDYQSWRWRAISFIALKPRCGPLSRLTPGMHRSCFSSPKCWRAAVGSARQKRRDDRRASSDGSGMLRRCASVRRRSGLTVKQKIEANLARSAQRRDRTVTVSSKWRYAVFGGPA